MNTYRTPWARINCNWPSWRDHLPVEELRVPEHIRKRLYAEYVEAGHPDPESQHQFIKAAEVLGLSDPYVLINRQHPGQQMPIHTDLGSARRYHYMTEEQRHKKLERCFLFLDDWQPGQVIQMQDEMIQNWKCGDVLWFDWRTTPHGTANFGKKIRPLLLITGVATPEWQKIHNSSRLTEFNL